MKDTKYLEIIKAPVITEKSEIINLLHQDAERWVH